MIALIDLDPLPYAYGGLTFDDGIVMPDSILRKMVDDKIKDIVEKSGSDDWLGYLTESHSNFRIDIATILPYKGNRDGLEKPARYQMLRDYLLDKYSDKVTLVKKMEADDMLSIAQLSFAQDNIDSNIEDPYSETIICTIDKDLRMVPGWHYEWVRGDKEEKEPFFVTEVEGLRFFYKQLLTGDMTDNIRGLYGVGQKSALVKAIDDMDTEQAMFLHVYEEYKKRFGNYADQFMLENGRLLWMLTKEGELWQFPEINHDENDEELPWQF